MAGVDLVALLPALATTFAMGLAYGADVVALLGDGGAAALVAGALAVAVLPWRPS